MVGLFQIYVIGEANYWMVGGRWGMVGSRMVGLLVFDKNALAITLVVALVTVERVRVMCV